ncbi:hypothetical protein V8F06_009389 [Rhypophila decipiens]
MPPTSLPIRRRNAVRRRRQRSSPQQEQQQQQPSASPQQQQQQHQQQQQQPTGGGPQTLVRPFSFDGREAITTQPTSSTLATQQRANANPQPVPVPVPAALAAQAAGTKASQAPRACSSPDRGQSNPCAPERPDHHSSSFHDESWTSAYEDSGLTGNESRNYELGPAERQSRSMTLGPQVRASTWRKLIPSNPFADDDDDDDDEKEDERAEATAAAQAATRASCRDENNEAGDLDGEDRRAGVISRCYGSSSKELDNLPAVPRARRRERSSSSVASVVSDVSESSGRRSRWWWQPEAEEEEETVCLVGENLTMRLCSFIIDKYKIPQSKQHPVPDILGREHYETKPSRDVRISVPVQHIEQDRFLFAPGRGSNSMASSLVLALGEDGHTATVEKGQGADLHWQWMGYDGPNPSPVILDGDTAQSHIQQPHSQGSPNEDLGTLSAGFDLLPAWTLWDEDFARKLFEPPASLVTPGFGAPVLSYTHRRTCGKCREAETVGKMEILYSYAIQRPESRLDPRRTFNRDRTDRDQDLRGLPRWCWNGVHGQCPTPEFTATTVYIAQSSDQGRFHFLS